MIERIENGLQLAVLAVCAAAAMVKALRTRERTWTLLTLFCASWALGDVYWLVCLLFFGQTPQISAVSDLNWCASFIFLYLLLREAAPPDGAREKRLLPWLGPVFAAGMAVFYMQWGQILSNLVYAALMGLLLFASVRRLADREKYARQRFLCGLVLAFCLLEYALWTASCIWSGETLANPYYWIDLALSLSFVLFLPAVWKVWKEGTAA